jgi:hypothetical protein
MGATAGLVSGGLQAVSGPTAQAAQQAGASAEMAGPTAPTAPSGGIGRIGTASEMLSMPMSEAGGVSPIQQGAMAPSATVATGAPPPTVSGVPDYAAMDYGRSLAPASTGSAGLTMPMAEASQIPQLQDRGFFGRMAQGATDLYNEYLSPSRPGLPADAGLIRKYAPLAAAGTAVAGALGAFKTPPTEEEPLYSNKAWMQRAEQERLSREQQLANVDYGLTRGIPMPPAPQAPMPAAPMPASPMPTTPPIFNPAPATPGFGPIAQPYNVPGLYGIPLLYGPQPVRAARGGEMRPTEFPRKIGAINGPGTGTSDSIPAMLSDGEFVFTAKAVRNAGGGSRRKGAARMYKMMKMLEGGPVKGK